MIKPLRYKNKAIVIFAKLKHLVQRFQRAVIEHKMIWDSIILIVVLNSLYNNFEIIIVFFFYSDNKDLEKIQLNIIFIKAANLGKWTTVIIGDLAMMAKEENYYSKL